MVAIYFHNCYKDKGEVGGIDSKVKHSSKMLRQNACERFFINTVPYTKRLLVASIQKVRSGISHTRSSKQGAATS